MVVGVAGKDTPSSGATLTVTPGSLPTVEPYLGLNFVGGGTGGGESLTPLDVAGAVPQDHWNNLDGFTFDPAVSPALIDAKGSNSPVTLTSSSAAGTWYTGTRVAGSADGALLQGYIDALASTNPVTFTLNNVPAGNYKVLVYSVGFDFNPNYFQAYTVTGATVSATIHGHAETGLSYISNPAYRRMASQNAAAPDVGNYVQIDNVNPAVDGSISIDVAWEPADPSISNGQSPAINAIQLVRTTAVGPVLSIQRGPGSSLTISWTGVGRLQESSTLTSGSWTNVTGNPSGSYVVNPGTTGAKFHRVIVP